MGRFFSMDNPAMAYFAKLRDWITLSALWAVCSLPVLTVGAATASMYYVSLKLAKGEEVSVTAGFFHAFKDNLRQGIALTLILAAGAAALLFAYLSLMGVAGTVGTILRVAVFSLAVSYMCMLVYAFPFQAQFVNSVSGILKSAVVLAARNMTSTILILLLNTLPIWVLLLSVEVFMRLLPLWVFLVPGAVSYLCALRLVKVFAPLIEKIQNSNVPAAQPE